MSLALHLPFYQNPSLTDIASSVAFALTRTTKQPSPDVDGWLRYMQNGEAAFDGATFRHNLIWPSSNPFQTNWNVDGSTVTQSAAANPVDGSVDVTLFTSNTSLTSHGTFNTTNPWGIPAAGRQILTSVYVKPNGYDGFSLGTAGAQGYCGFDLSDGSFVAAGTDILDYGIEAEDDGFYRVWTVTDITDSGGPDYRLYYGPVASISGTGSLGSYTGDGSSGMYYYGLMVEDVSGRWDSENLLIRSNDFSTGWLTTNVSDAQNAEDKDGVANSAWTITTTSTGFCKIGQVVTVTGPGRYRASVTVKAGTTDWVAFGNESWSSGVSGVSYFNVSTGAAGNTDGDHYNITITDVGNGFYRLSYEFDVWADDLSGQVSLYPAEGNGDADNAASGYTVIIQDFQLERNKPRQVTHGTYLETTTAADISYSPSPFIETSTAALTNLSGSNNGLDSVWETRTNRCLYSEQLDDASWTVNFVSVSADSSIAPDGSQTFDLVVPSTDNNANHYINSSIISTSAAEYTISMFVKAAGYDHVALKDANVTGYVEFNLASGSITSTSGSYTGRIEDLGNSIYRIAVTFTSTGTARVMAYVFDAAGLGSFAGDGSKGVLMWGAQCELGGWAGPYIATTSSTATRSSCLINGTDVSWHNLDEGTWYAHVELGASAENGTFKRIFSLHNGGANDIESIGTAAGVATSSNWVYRSTALEVNSGSTGIHTDGAENRLVLGIATDDASEYYNGNAGITDASVDLTGSGTPMSGMGIGNLGYAGLYFWNGLIKEIRYYDTSLSKADQENMSNGVFPTEGQTYGPGLTFGRMGAQGLN